MLIALHIRNTDEGEHAVQEGDRIAQLIIEKIQTPDVVEVTVSIFIATRCPGSENCGDRILTRRCGEQVVSGRPGGILRSRLIRREAIIM